MMKDGVDTATVAMNERDLECVPLQHLNSIKAAGIINIAAVAFCTAAAPPSRTTIAVIGRLAFLGSRRRLALAWEARCPIW